MNTENAMTREDVLLWWNACCYTVCLYLLGVGLLKILIIFPIVLISSYVNYGRKWILRIGFVLLVLTVLVTMDILPQPNNWPGLVASVAGWLRA